MLCEALMGGVFNCVKLPTYYSTMTPFYLIRKREHTKYLSVLHSRLSYYNYYTLMSQFEDREAIMKEISVK